MTALEEARRLAVAIALYDGAARWIPARRMEIRPPWAELSDDNRQRWLDQAGDAISAYKATKTLERPTKTDSVKVSFEKCAPGARDWHRAEKVMHGNRYKTAREQAEAWARDLAVLVASGEVRDYRIDGEPFPAEARP